METFIAGFFYGLTTVIVGQPLDTIKTRLQASISYKHANSLAVFRDIYFKEGVAGLYRGGSYLLIGGGLIRSAQFGVYNNSLAWIRLNFGVVTKEERLFHVFDPHIIAAGFLGGLGRGLVETPFEFMKTRRQVDNTFRWADIMKGSGATLLRNSFLFSSFAVSMDMSKQIVEGGLSPFWTGAICANLAWLTIWPLDVIKSQVQSGLHESKSVKALLLQNIKQGVFFKGLVPGLTRSFISNGCSMVVYDKVLNMMKEDKQ